MGNSKSKQKYDEEELRNEINKVLDQYRSESKVNGVFENLKHDYYNQGPGSYVYTKRIDKDGKIHNLENYGDFDTSEFKVNIVKCTGDVSEFAGNKIYDANNCPANCTCELHNIHVNLKEKLDAYHNHKHDQNNTGNNQYGSYITGDYDVPDIQYGSYMAGGNYDLANEPTSDYGLYEMDRMQYGGDDDDDDDDNDNDNNNDLDELTDFESDDVDLGQISDIGTTELERIQSKIYNSTESDGSIKHVYDITNRKPVNFRNNILDSSENNIMKMSKGRTNPKYR